MKKKVHPGMFVLVILAAVGIALYVDNMSQPQNTPLSQPQQKRPKVTRMAKNEAEARQGAAKEKSASKQKSQSASAPEKRAGTLTPGQKAMKRAAAMAGAGA